MEAFQIYSIVAVAVLIILVSSIVLVVKQKRVTKQNNSIQAEKKANRRDNFRLRVNIKQSILEVLKVGSIVVNQSDQCEIVNISAGGVGVVSYYDFPLKQSIYVRVHFYLNAEEFSLNGRIVRKAERINKSGFLYGIQFLNLSASDQNRLMKEVFAMENERRKMEII
ncbi:PilZ domain-containing protein [Neobacillus sp. FSL H8-0543]|uniref:PilZ domain-containing protein n=1 Tax=Neobacillus sp. FSL H8-0543 TaxID=2954672 RepID=UPI003158F6AC